LIAVITIFFLYLFAMDIGLPFIMSVLFSFMVFAGKQSVVLWELIHGEGLAMLLASLALLIISRSINRQSLRKTYGVVAV